MKKILLIIAIFLINIPVVLAENSAYLSELSVGQGELSPSFDKNNNTYTIDIDDDVTKLDINYTLEDDNATVEILDNDLITEKNHTVTIKISNNEEIQIYKILVNKIKNESVASLNNNSINLKITKKRNMKFILIIIVISWLFLTLLLRRLMFGKFKVSKK
jgi:hypothetical protein